LLSGLNFSLSSVFRLYHRFSVDGVIIFWWFFFVEYEVWCVEVLLWVDYYVVFVCVVLLFVFFVVVFEVDPFVALFLHVGDELRYSVFLSVINSRHQIGV